MDATPSEIQATSAFPCWHGLFAIDPDRRCREPAIWRSTAALCTQMTWCALHHHLKDVPLRNPYGRDAT